MMNFKLIFRRECWNLWNFIKIRLLFVVIILTLLIYVLCINNENYTVSSIIYALLQLHKDSSNPLLENIGWFTIQLLPLLLIGSYVYEDLFLSGPFLLLRIKSRSLLWLSKILILFLIILFYYLFIFILIQILGYFFHFSMLFESYLTFVDVLTIFLAFLLGSFTLVLLQSVLSMLVTPIFGIVLSIILLVVNMVLELSIIPGNIVDVFAYSVFNGEQSFTLGVVLQLLWMLLVIFVGQFYYKRVDLLYRN